MFRRKACEICKEKQVQIDYLTKQLEDYKDRLMAYSKEAFLYYKAEDGKPKPNLFPIATTDKGESFTYKDMNSEESQEEIHRAFGEEVINVEDEK